MSDSVRLQEILSTVEGPPDDRRAVFALLALGVIDALAAGVLTASEATRRFFTADNCIYVRRQLRDRTADDVMGRGVQLWDLFEVLPAEEANRSFRHELELMRGSCRRLLEAERVAA